MKITLAQINPTVGDLSGNLQKIEDTLKVCPQDSDLLIFSELVLTGYPPKDLLKNPWFIQKTGNAQEKLCELSKTYPTLGILLGLPTQQKTTNGQGLYNSAILIQNGETLFQQNKQFLPAYDVFDETRYFDSAQDQAVFPFKGETLGITICEDVWNDYEFWPKPLYVNDPVEELVQKGATLLINLAASPFEVDKQYLRHNLVRSHIRRRQTPFVMINQVGANDDLIFDGHSFAMDAQGHIIANAKGFAEDLVTFDTENHHHAAKPDSGLSPFKDIYKALTLGVKDYFSKCRAKQAVIGLSGGIDSAIVAVIAQKALGSKNVLGISMPTRYSSKGSVSDSEQLANNLNIAFKTIPIHDVLQTYETIFEQEFQGRDKDTTEENIQARIRGNILMAFSNKEGRLLLTTGNKTEIALGYCTIYGDMCGALAVISDLPKTMIYKLARFINANSELIPTNIITKPPSAELRPDQKDQDTLPPYDILDAILEHYLVQHLSREDITGKGFDPEITKWVIQTVNHNEYKRRQMPPGLKLTSKAFGTGRRFPIAANHWF
jgi:NAD+ synthase (glutamine-hydrolysing)